ncbi:MAG: hypothetical protein H6736_22045 [Alphaproteobacteria bacterium]|nr:hypothetical protein [Alphaproteobacteria bacterium]
MRAFCEDLAIGPWLSLPVVQAERRWGVALDRLRDAGVLRVRGPREGESFPCGVDGEPGCARELVLEGDAWLAVCGSDSPYCEPEAVDARFADLSEAGLLAFLARVCGVEGPPVGEGLVDLGTRRVGPHTLGFAWAHRPQTLDLTKVERLVEASVPNALVVLVPARRSLQRVVPARLGRTRVLWLPLDEVIEDPDRLDLAELWLRFGLGSIELLWPRFDLVLDGPMALWGGRWVELARNPQHRLLVDTLLAAHGQYVSRADLLPTLFPDEFTNRGRMLSDPGKLDRRLRQLVSRVNAHFGAHPDGRALIGNLRGRSDLDGGYRIEVDPDRFTTQEVHDDR